MQVVKLTLLTAKHLPLMILESSAAMSTTRVHECTALRNTILHNVATPVDGSLTIDEEPSLVQKDKRQANSMHCMFINIPKVSS